MIVWAVLRIAGSVTALVAVYYVLPLDHSSTGIAVTILVIGLAVFIALVAFQVRSIIASPFPGLRAIESLATSVPLFLLLFAGSYVVMSAMSDANFDGRLTHTDGLYFTVTVFSTVGFGDITAKTQAARLVVTGQMIADLVILGLAVKVIMGAVSRQPTIGRLRRRIASERLRYPPSTPNRSPPLHNPAWQRTERHKLGTAVHQTLGCVAHQAEPKCRTSSGARHCYPSTYLAISPMNRLYRGGWLGGFDFAGAPGLVEERLEWVVEPQGREEAFAGDGLEPVRLGPPSGAVGPK